MIALEPEKYIIAESKSEKYIISESHDKIIATCNYFTMAFKSKLW